MKSMPYPFGKCTSVRRLYDDLDPVGHQLRHMTWRQWRPSFPYWIVLPAQGQNRTIAAGMRAGGHLTVTAVSSSLVGDGWYWCWCGDCRPCARQVIGGSSEHFGLSTMQLLQHTLVKLTLVSRQYCVITGTQGIFKTNKQTNQELDAPIVIDSRWNTDIFCCSYCQSTGSPTRFHLVCNFSVALNFYSFISTNSKPLHVTDFRL